MKENVCSTVLQLEDRSESAAMSMQMRTRGSTGRVAAASLPLLIFACSTWKTHAFFGGLIQLAPQTSQRSIGIPGKRPQNSRNPLLASCFPAAHQGGRIDRVRLPAPFGSVPGTRNVCLKMATTDVDGTSDMKTEIRRSVKGIQDKYE